MRTFSLWLKELRNRVLCVILVMSLFNTISCRVCIFYIFFGKLVFGFSVLSLIFVLNQLFWIKTLTNLWLCYEILFSFQGTLMKIWKSTNIFVFTWKYYATRDIWNVCLQTYWNNRLCLKIAYFLKKIQYSQLENS